MPLNTEFKKNFMGMVVELGTGKYDSFIKLKLKGRRYIAIVADTA